MHSERRVPLRIITAYQLAAERGAAYILELEGRIQGDSVELLRRAWRALQGVVPEVPISVVLADVECVDAAGKALLAEMHRAGTVVTQPFASESCSASARNILEAGGPA